MRKKIVCSLIMSSLVVAGTVQAEQIIEENVVVTSETTVYHDKTNFITEESSNAQIHDELYDFVSIFQSTLVNLTESDKEKLTLLLDFVSSTSQQLEQLLIAEQYEQATAVFERYNDDLLTIHELIEREQQVSEEVVEKDEPTVDEEFLNEITEEISEKSSMRGVNLLALLERDDLPEQAKLGVQKALKNQQKAAENKQRAQERKERREMEKKQKKNVSEERLEEGKDEVVEETSGAEESVITKPENRGQERAEQARNNGPKVDQGQKRGHEAKERGQNRGQTKKEQSQHRGQGNGKGNSNGKGNNGKS